MVEAAEIGDVADRVGVTLVEEKAHHCIFKYSPDVALIIVVVRFEPARI